MEYPLIVLAGIAGSWHCVGMWGGFACTLGYDAHGRPATLARQLVYNLGRVTTYCFIGGLAGYLAANLVAGGMVVLPTLGAQRILALASGVLMMLFGLQLFGWSLRRHGRALVGLCTPFLLRSLPRSLRCP